MIFSNIVEVHSLAQSLLSSIEDTLEATEENETPFIGSCFEELAEVWLLLSYSISFSAGILYGHVLQEL